MIIITGAAGFVGQNLVKYLNNQGYTNLILVDSLANKNYFKNLIGLKYCDFLNFEKGIDFVENSLSKYENIDTIFHIGANADVLIEDCNIMMDMNFEHSKFWFEFAKKRNISLIYASSSAVYGNSNSFKVRAKDEQPHNEYAFSKLVFDNYVRCNLKTLNNKVIGYRFFNIFGLGEFHKGKNASLPYRFFNFIMDEKKGYIDLFDKEIKRDYVWVEDVCKILYITWKKDMPNGIYNLGSGNPISHEKLANIVIDIMREEGLLDIYTKDDVYIKKISMPKDLIDKFQYFTKADDLVPWINDITNNNEKKIKKYIQQLSERYRNDNKK